MASLQDRSERRGYRVREVGQCPLTFTEFRVSEPRQHPQGFTEYRVTTRIFSKKTPDVKEVTVFKRYSDFKKLHSELSYIHRNLFRKLEEFPVFPKAQVFGRFDQDVIEERRRCAEAMLQFTVNIPALYNSPQLKDFFKDGETHWPLELTTPKDVAVLPEPLIPLPMARADSGQRTLIPLARTDSGQGSDTPAEVGAEDSACAPLNTPMFPAQGTPDELDTVWTSEEEACVPFHSADKVDNEERELHSTSFLPASDLALFDPCAKEDAVPEAARQSNLEALTVPGSQAEERSAAEDLEGRLATLRVWRDTEAPPADRRQDPTDYLSAAAQCIKEALEQEACGQYEPAYSCYLDGVDVLLRGLQGELSAERQDAIKKRTAEYLKRAEAIFALHLKGTCQKDAPPPS